MINDDYVDEKRYNVYKNTSEDIDRVDNKIVLEKRTFDKNKLKGIY